MSGLSILKIKPFHLVKIFVMFACGFIALSLYAETSNSIVGLSRNELEAPPWQFCGREQISAVGDLNSDATRFWINVDGRSDYFSVEKDTVCWMGYNLGTRQKMTPGKVVEFTKDHDSSQAYAATGAIDVNFPLFEQGEFTAKKVGVGDVLISPTDTMSNIVLVSLSWRYNIRSDNDEIISTNDSDSDADIIDRIIYLWYVPGQNIPFAFQCNDKLFVAGYDSTIEDDNLNIDESEMAINIINAAQIGLEGNSIVVSLSDDLSISVYVMDAMGNIYASSSCFANEARMDVTSFLPGNYIVSIQSDRVPGCNRKEVITLK